MQRILSITKTVTCLSNQILPKRVDICQRYFSAFNNIVGEKFLRTFVPNVNSICGMKVKGRVRRRCKSCYLVFRDQRAYIMCKEHPRHKQMAMKPKPHNTWILTHASQSPVRQW